MKKSIIIITLLIVVCISNKTTGQTLTSVANGNWTSPSTWGGMVPTPGSNVIINHIVTLNTDWYSNGSITINATGSLIGISSNRGLAVGNKLNVYGTLNVARVALYAGKVTNNGLFQVDSLRNYTTILNNSGATLNAGQFQISMGGSLYNEGSIESTYLANTDSVVNSGTITCYNITNSKSFINLTTGLLDISNNFLNTDSLASPGIFANYGMVRVDNNWRNTDQVNGSGKFCVQNNTNNSGEMSGTFDFCDLTGGNIDINTGTIASSITYCLYSCIIGIDKDSQITLIKLYPNPNNGIFSIFNTNKSLKLNVEIFNMLGEKIYTLPLVEKSDIDLTDHSEGIYIYQIKRENEIINTGKIILDKK